MSLMYPDWVTLWNKLPQEDAQGRAQWKRTVLNHTRFEEVRGAQRWLNGEQSQDSVQLYISFRAGFKAPHEYDGTGWTLAAGDKVAYGSIEDAEPPAPAHTIVTADTLRLQGPNPHHWEVTCR